MPYILRVSLISWLAWLDRLATKERLKKWNVQLTSNLCDCFGTELETQNHLFFSCTSTGRIWQLTLARLGFHRDPVNWESECGWLLQQQGKSIDSGDCRLLWTQYKHTIWMERNKRIFDHKARSDEELSRIIVDTIKLKIFVLHGAQAAILLESFCA